MRKNLNPLALGLLLLAGCNSGLDPGPLAAELKSDPSIMVMGPGESKTVTIEAFLGGQPVSVNWNIGAQGQGVQVTEDTTYGRTYVGGVLVLPPHSHSRRFEVTMNDTLVTSFVISGGTGTITIPVHPPVP